MPDDYWRTASREAAAAGGDLVRLQSAPAMSATPRVWRARRLVDRSVNHVTRLFAGWLPWFAILTHVGRRLGRIYENSINTFRRGKYYVFALTYESNVD